MAATLTRGVSGLLRPLSALGRDFIAPALTLPQTRRFSTVVQKHVCKPQAVVQISVPVRRTLLLHCVKPLMPSLGLQPNRSLTYYSVKKGKRKSVKSVVKRFLRLHCGLWVRRRAGYKKKLWKKSPARKKRLREHVFCNKTQSKLLDKMTTSFWKRRNWFLNDPYQKYHDRVNLKL